MKKHLFLLTVILVLSLALVSCSSKKQEPLSKNDNGHVFLDAKDKGDSKKLCGNVLFAVFFVSDDNLSWSENEKNISRRLYEIEADILLKEAQKYGAELNIDFVYFDCTSNLTLDMFDNSKWISDAIKSAGLSETDNTVEFLKNHYNKDEVAIIFSVKNQGRSFSLPTNESDGFECAFIYNNTSFRHEILHLFGAKDFYYPSDIKIKAKEILGESIMLNSLMDTVDEFTAYLIGWSSTPTEIAQSFIDETAKISQEEINKATEQQTLTGNGQQSSDSGLYEGDLVDGTMHGKGTFYFDDGAIYTGDFKNGNMEGVGTYIWNDGSIYTGEFKNGVPFGQGTRIMINGSTYTGSFINGEMTGQGTIILEDGTKYTGEFVDGYRTGEGTIIYPDGTTYTGDFIKGSYHGYGTLKKADGTVQSGYFDHNKYFGVDENTPWYYVDQ